MKVLIVDDEKTALDIVIHAVSWHEYHIEAIAAADGEEALQTIAKERIDIVITDIKMPKMDGLELIRRINSMNQGIICIVMSSYNEFDLVRAAMQLGAYDYLFKPTMMPEDILAVVQKAEEKLRREKVVSKELYQNIDRRDAFRVLLNNSEVKEEFKNSLTAKIQANERTLVAVLKLQIAQYQERLKLSFHGDYDLMRFTIENILNELARDILRIEVVAVNFYEYHLVIWSEQKTDTKDTFEEKLIDYVKHAREVFHQYYHFSCSFGISRIEHDFEQLFDQRIEAQKYMERAAVTGQLFISYRDEASMELSEVMKQSLYYIADNLYSKELSLQAVADYVGLSRNYFSKLFKEEVGSNFVDYITRKKLEKAKELYVTTDMKIYEIADKLGYSDWHYLYALYKKEYGHSLSKEKNYNN